MSSHSLTIKAPALYALALNAPMGTRLLVAVLFERARAGKPFTPSQAKLARMVHRHERTVRRWLKVGAQRGWIKVIRRGRKQTNVYRLTGALWRRLTGQHPSRLPRTLQESLLRLGLHAGLGEREMSRRGALTRR
jgi:hypothetical protein